MQATPRKKTSDDARLDMSQSFHRSIEILFHIIPVVVELVANQDKSSKTCKELSVVVDALRMIHPTLHAASKTYVTGMNTEYAYQRELCSDAYLAGSTCEPQTKSNQEGEMESLESSVGTIKLSQGSCNDADHGTH